jgi:hypothetical protein
MNQCLQHHPNLQLLDFLSLKTSPRYQLHGVTSLHARNAADADYCIIKEGRRGKRIKLAVNSMLRIFISIALILAAAF